MSGNRFESFAHWLAERMGKPRTFALAITGIVAWTMSGPVFGFNDTWQLIVNTSTTIITFLMVFLIQSTQNRDTDELHLKLDELLRATKGAEERMMALDDKTAKELKALREENAKEGRNCSQCD